MCVHSKDVLQLIKKHFYCRRASIHKNISLIYYKEYILKKGVRGGVVVKALHYKPAGRGFDSRWRHLNFSVT
jgi:hypothetical protein